MTRRPELSFQRTKRSIVSAVHEKHGRIDVLFVNAGMAKLAPVESTSEELFDEIMGTNFRGAYFTVQKALRFFSDGGAIIFTTSYFTREGIAGTSTVSASKAALRSLTRTKSLSASMPGIPGNCSSIWKHVFLRYIHRRIGLSKLFRIFQWRAPMRLQLSKRLAAPEGRSSANNLAALSNEELEMRSVLSPVRSSSTMNETNRHRGAPLQS